MMEYYPFHCGAVRCVLHCMLIRRSNKFSVPVISSRTGKQRCWVAVEQKRNFRNNSMWFKLIQSPQMNHPVHACVEIFVNEIIKQNSNVCISNIFMEINFYFPFSSNIFNVTYYDRPHYHHQGNSFLF